MAIYEGAGTVWLAGASGLAFFNGQQIERVRSDDEIILRGTSGIAFDRMGNLWLNSGSGALRIQSKSVMDLIHRPDHFTHVEVFDERDGPSGKPA